MWNCTNCGEQVDDEFHICWNCQCEKEAVNARPDKVDIRSPVAQAAPTSHRAIKEQLSHDASSVLSGYLKPNEALQHWARGVVPWQYSFGSLRAGRAVLLLMALPAFILIVELGKLEKSPEWLILALWYPCIFLAFWRARKKCIVGLTDSRFIAVTFRTHPNKRKVFEYSLAGLPRVEILNTSDENFVTIKVRDKQRPFIGNFHSEHMPNNRMHFKAIAKILSERQTQPLLKSTLGI